MSDLQEKFRKNPGCRERHLRRKLDNPLFPADQRDTTIEELNAEQLRDDEELTTFLSQVKSLVSKVTALSIDSDLSEIVELKTRADAYYAQCLGLPGDQRRVKAALIKLIAELTRLDMETMQDTESLVELKNEQVNRLAHFTRLEFPLAADICRVQSPVSDGELVPTLLSEPSEALNAALSFFDAREVASIREEARSLIASRKEEGFDMSAAEQNLAVIAKRLEEDGT